MPDGGRSWEARRPVPAAHTRLPRLPLPDRWVRRVANASAPASRHGRISGGAAVGALPPPPSTCHGEPPAGTFLSPTFKVDRERRVLPPPALRRAAAWSRGFARPTPPPTPSIRPSPLHALFLPMRSRQTPWDVTGGSPTHFVRVRGRCPRASHTLFPLRGRCGGRRRGEGAATAGASRPPVGEGSGV